ncbi:MAG: ferritin-like domain-containing protein [Rhodococcus sp.]|uniref:ferritin-like domain-containing protein n=1 Tax=Rhodococcus TaxID=1827 RepID=UPI00169C6E1B|nr:MULTISPECIES: ferritin-like domain-containing protein [Rhodococcus]NLV78440.1 ferritin-like domain-containing protein [Rhodococcus sp. (in: high G+C Gram-positive bacteria)]
MSSPELGSEQQSLIDALAVEHAAVFGYGVVAAFADPGRADEVAADTAAHRARRDATVDTLTAAGVTPPVAAPGYTVPFPVADPVQAAELAVQIETDVAVAWRSVLERADTEAVRADAVVALTESAIRAARWRSNLGIVPPTVAFPGRP